VANLLENQGLGESIAYIAKQKEIKKGFLMKQLAGFEV
jgi:hypothetical protein